LNAEPRRGGKALIIVSEYAESQAQGAKKLGGLDA
jgi:hypothetical protein